MAATATVVPLAPGALQPLALRLRFATPAVLNNVPLLDALVTCPVSAGTALGFRFFAPTDTYLSPGAVVAGFITEAACLPGDVLRVAFKTVPGQGLVLLRLRYTPCNPTPSVLTVGTCTAVFTTAVAGYSCYLYWTPRPTVCCGGVVGLAAIAAGPGAAAGLPPPCVLPCQFALVPNVEFPLPTDDTGQYVVYDGAASTAVPAAWVAAWRLLKYGPWVTLADTGFTVWDTALGALESALYIALPPGALVPLAVRPHAANTAWTAQLALVATVPIPAGTQVSVTAALGSDPATLPTYWVWTSPTTTDLPAGTVVDMNALGVTAGASPVVNVGTIAADATVLPLGLDAALTDFTVFARSPCGPSDPITHFITAVYTCSRPADTPLPEALVPGVAMPLVPWPAGPAVLPVAGRCCVPVPPAAWRCKGLALCSTPPVAWACGTTPVPCFATAGACPVCPSGSCCC
jgi:hypothetical protein